MAQAWAHAAEGAGVLQTRCGPIEVQEAGTGVPLLEVHGSSGVHGQGMAFAGALAKHRIRVIAMSRFGCANTRLKLTNFNISGSSHRTDVAVQGNS